MTPCLANWPLEKSGLDPLPNTKAPPWIHTMTGSLAPGSAPAGLHTLRNRQSSEEFSRTELAEPKPLCAQSAPNVLASRSFHGGIGWGGRQRLVPTGAAA